MSSIVHAARARINRFAIALAVVGFTAACQPVRTAPEPVVTALVVRNASAFEINVYAIPKSDAKPIWLGTVSASATRSMPLVARTMDDQGGFVVQAQAIGSSRSWTSSTVLLDAATVAVLDLAATGSGDCSASQLRSVSVSDLFAAMK
jgi:hypothetical protein